MRISNSGLELFYFVLNCHKTSKLHETVLHSYNGILKDVINATFSLFISEPFFEFFMNCIFASMLTLSHFDDLQKRIASIECL